MKEIIEKALKRSGMTQKELAEKLYVTPQAVSKWVKGESEPSRENVIEICKILNVDLIKEKLKNERKDRIAMKQNHIALEDIDSIEKAKEETKLILEETKVADNYKHSIIVLLNYLIPAVIGLTRHHFNKDKKKELSIDYDSIFYNLESFFYEDLLTKKRNELERVFYFMGGDLFEATGEDDLENIDLIHDSMDMWYRFKDVIGEKYDSPLLGDFKAALSEITYHYLQMQ